MLFGIEKVLFQTAVDKAKGDLAKAEADEKLAISNLREGSRLLKPGQCRKLMSILRKPSRKRRQLA